MFLHIRPLINKWSYRIRNLPFASNLKLCRSTDWRDFRLLESLLMHNLVLIRGLRILRFEVRDDQIWLCLLQPDGALQKMIIILIRLLFLARIQVGLYEHVSGDKLLLA